VSVRTCLHPNCRASMPRSRYCCSRHWYQLPAEIRESILAAAKSNSSTLEQLLVEAAEYLSDRMIGDLEVALCRGKDCGADIVWLVTKAGKAIAVDAEQVEEGDDQFEYGRHIAHFTTCPNADDFRRRT